MRFLQQCIDTRWRLPTGQLGLYRQPGHPDTVRDVWIAAWGRHLHSDNKHPGQSISVHELGSESTNVSNYRGGGMFVNDNVHITFQDCLFKGNDAAVNSSADGGGIMLDPSTSVTFDQCEFRSNTATDAGGAVYSSGSVLAEDCDFYTNLGYGGAIFGAGTGDVEFNDCTFLSNYSNGSGGTLWLHDDATGSATNCTFDGNDATGGSGGVLFVRSGGFSFERLYLQPERG